jgi:hypothetical protein
MAMAVLQSSFTCLLHCLEIYCVLRMCGYNGTLNFYSPVVTTRTVQWSLYVPYSGHYMYRQFNIQQFYMVLALR